MENLTEMTQELLVTLEQQWHVILNVLVLILMLFAITHFLSPKNAQEKNEALKEVSLFGGMLVIIYFILAVVSTLGQSAGRPGYLTELIGLWTLAYGLLYQTKISAKKQGKPSFHMKAYRELNEIEEWLDAKGRNGFLCTGAFPDMFGFNLLQTANKYQYKTAYYPSSKRKAMQAFVDKNELDGWELVSASLANTSQQTPNKTIGASAIAVFKTSDLTLPKGTPARFDYQPLRRKLRPTLIANLAALTLAILATCYFKEVPFLVNCAALIGFVACLQLFLYFYLNKKPLSIQAETKETHIS